MLDAATVVGDDGGDLVGEGDVALGESVDVVAGDGEVDEAVAQVDLGVVVALLGDGAGGLGLGFGAGEGRGHGVDFTSGVGAGEPSLSNLRHAILAR